MVAGTGTVTRFARSSQIRVRVLRNAKSRPAGRLFPFRWWRGSDLNQRPSGYEPDELPDCSTPRREVEGTGAHPETPTELVNLSPILDVRGSA